ncbi:hypothetical protein [Clostridium botulinum]|uniref:hypothetical protein n=1 Tax=Clostridium botulinum TaxID=1491 RepID=UPI001E5692D0|nr:hypothetical protein [Clostridium botulinum]MCD3254367.1 hypothetical protein [Clostridium botulinum C/D]MCD3279867.1 hypothetical protein [Clostridium botulinum C/D]MCD3339598.1 hypothetical protein [Clostridium botulinum C/D]MCD3357506.1 hypothetical protein [Clostridium botulinum C/D]
MKKETRTQLGNLEKVFKANYGYFTEIGVSEDKYIFRVQLNENERAEMEVLIDLKKRPADYFKIIEKGLEAKQYKTVKITNIEKLLQAKIDEYECKNIHIALDSLWYENMEVSLLCCDNINNINDFLVTIKDDDYEYEINFLDDEITMTELNGWDIEGLENKLRYINQLNANEYNSKIRYYIVDDQLVELDYEDGTFVVMVDDLDNIKSFDNTEFEDGTINKEELVLEFYNSDEPMGTMCYYIETNNLCCC